MLRRVAVVSRVARMGGRRWLSTSLRVTEEGSAPVSRMINNPDTQSPYPQSSVSSDGMTGTWKQRLARMPVIGRFINDDTPDPREEMNKWQQKPRHNGVFFGQTHLCLASPNVTIDRYEPPKSRAVAVELEDGTTETALETVPRSKQGVFSREGWSEFRKGAGEARQNTTALAAIKKEMEGFTKEKFAEASEEWYQIITSAIFSGSRTVLRQLATERVQTQLKRQIATRSCAGVDGSELEYDWQLLGMTYDPEVVQLRAFPIRDESDVWAQITVKFESMQALSVRHKETGELLQETPATGVPVVEYWVFERRLAAEDAFWRLCDRIEPVLADQE